MDILDLLLEAAKKQVKPAAKKDVRIMRQAQDIKKPHISTYQKAENWTEAEVVTLIHQGEDSSITLLGNFQEYFHKDGARKLVRITEPKISTKTEYVKGDWWLTPQQEELHAPAGSHWTKTYQLTIGITLRELVLHSPEVLVTVTTTFGHIAKVELDDETRFFSSEHNQFLMLHRGTDVLGCMDLNSKLDLRSTIENLSETDNEATSMDANQQSA